jgi:hypothetical protein
MDASGSASGMMPRSAGMKKIMALPDQRNSLSRYHQSPN